MDESTFSRKRGSDPLGKLLPFTVNLPERMAEDMMRESRLCGVTASHFLRQLLHVRLYGEDHAIRMAAEQISRIAGTASESHAETLALPDEN